MHRMRPMVILFAVVIRGGQSMGKSAGKQCVARASLGRMGLLSRFQSRRAAAPPATAGELWQSGVFEVEQLSSEAHAVHVPGRAPRIVPAFAVDFALGCEKFRLL